MSTENTKPRVDKRFFSDQLMLELGRALVDQGHIARAQLDDINSRRALTGENLDRMLAKESLVEEQVILETLSGLTHIPFQHIAD